MPKRRIVSQDRADFELWQGGGGISSKTVDRKMVLRVLDERLTPIQREYITDYFFSRLTMRQIAENRGVARSTVSRTIKRAENRIRDALKYCVRS